MQKLRTLRIGNAARLQVFCIAYPEFSGRIHTFHPLLPLRGSAAYLAFLNNVFLQFLKKLEKRPYCPLVFELYPGGGFCLDDPGSDTRLRRICKSREFYKVIVTQTITFEYLLRKKFCTEDQTSYLLYGAVVPSHLLMNLPHRRVRHGIEKESVDICFRSFFKYMPCGSDKGYDLFIASAHILSSRVSKARFHVIGNSRRKRLRIAHQKPED